MSSTIEPTIQITINSEIEHQYDDATLWRLVDLWLENGALLDKVCHRQFYQRLALVLQECTEMCVADVLERVPLDEAQLVRACRKRAEKGRWGNRVVNFGNGRPDVGRLNRYRADYKHPPERILLPEELELIHFFEPPEKTEEHFEPDTDRDSTVDVRWQKSLKYDIVRGYRCYDLYITCPSEWHTKEGSRRRHIQVARVSRTNVRNMNFTQVITRLVLRYFSSGKADQGMGLNHPLDIPLSLLSVCQIMAISLVEFVKFMVPRLRNNPDELEKAMQELIQIHPHLVRQDTEHMHKDATTMYPLVQPMLCEWLGFSLDLASYCAYDSTASMTCENAVSHVSLDSEQSLIQCLGRTLEAATRIHLRYSGFVVAPLPNHLMYVLHRAQNCGTLSPDSQRVLAAYDELCDALKDLCVPLHLKRAVLADAADKLDARLTAAATAALELMSKNDNTESSKTPDTTTTSTEKSSTRLRAQDITPSLEDAESSQEDEDLFLGIAMQQKEHMDKLRKSKRTAGTPDSSMMPTPEPGVSYYDLEDADENDMRMLLCNPELISQDEFDPAETDAFISDANENINCDDADEEDDELKTIDYGYSTPASVDNGRDTPTLDNVRWMYPTKNHFGASRQILPLWTLMDRRLPSSKVVDDSSFHVRTSTTQPLSMTQVMAACFSLLSFLTGSCGEDAARDPGSWGRKSHCGTCNVSRHKLLEKRWRDVSITFEHLMDAVLGDEDTCKLWQARWLSNGNTCTVCQWLGDVCVAARDVLGYLFNLYEQQAININTVWNDLRGSVERLRKCGRTMHANMLHALHFFRNVEQTLDAQRQSHWSPVRMTHVYLGRDPVRYVDYESTYSKMVCIDLGPATGQTLRHPYTLETTLFALKAMARDVAPDCVNSIKLLAEDNSLVLPERLLDYVQMFYGPTSCMRSWNRTIHDPLTDRSSLDVRMSLNGARLSSLDDMLLGDPKSLKYVFQWPSALRDAQSRVPERASRAFFWIKRLLDGNRGQMLGSQTLCFGMPCELQQYELLEPLLQSLYQDHDMEWQQRMVGDLLMIYRSDLSEHRQPRSPWQSEEGWTLYDLLWTFVHMRASHVLFRIPMLESLVVTVMQRYPKLNEAFPQIVQVCAAILDNQHTPFHTEWARVANPSGGHKTSPYYSRDLEALLQVVDVDNNTGKENSWFQSVMYCFFHMCANLPYMDLPEMSQMERVDLIRTVCAGICVYDRKSRYMLHPTSLCTSMLRKDMFHTRHPVCSIRYQNGVYRQWVTNHANQEPWASLLHSSCVSRTAVIMSALEVIALLPGPEMTDGVKINHEEAFNAANNVPFCTLRSIPRQKCVKKTGSLPMNWWKTDYGEQRFPRGMLNPQAVLDLGLFEGCHVYETDSDLRWLPEEDELPLLLSCYMENMGHENVDDGCGVVFMPRKFMFPLWDPVLRPAHRDPARLNHIVPYSHSFAPFVGSHPQLLAVLMRTQQPQFTMESAVSVLATHRFTHGFHQCMNPYTKRETPLFAGHRFEQWAKSCYDGFCDDSLEMNDTKEIRQMLRSSKINPSGTMMGMGLKFGDLVEDLRNSVQLLRTSSGGSSDCDN